MAALLVVSALFTSRGSLAEKPKAVSSASEWQKGRKLTPTRSETYRLSAGTSVTLAANSVAEVQPKVTLPSGVDGLAPAVYAAQLLTGRIDIAIDPKRVPANGVFIYGPRRMTVLARAGHVSIVAGPSGFAVGVYDGDHAASVGVGSTWKHIAAGNMFTVSAETPRGTESSLPLAPSRVSVDCPVLAIDGGARASNASWNSVSGAKRYILHLVDMETKKRKALQTADPSVALRGLDPGHYELRVAAIDELGLNGAFSEPTIVNVVGIVLPPGAFASQGKVYLEALQQLTLTHVDGLEASYDNAPVYFKAPRLVGLRGTQATTLHLRLPGASERASLELLPRDLHAQVEISPPLARWPRDKVFVRVRLPKTQSGTPSLLVVSSVTVNSRLLDVEWAQTDQGLEAVIPAPPFYPGPWIVRAEVADQHGIVIGRNFLEIASMAGLDDEDIPREIHRGPFRTQAQRW